MADFEIDDREFELFRENLKQFERDFPKEAKKMLRKVGNKAAVIVRKKARELVKKQKGNYYRSIKRGIVWKDENGDYHVRVYSNDPKQFLIEYGHRIISDGKDVGFVEGRYVFDKSIPEVEKQFNGIILAEFQKILNKL